jgi:hypothetical protein
MRRLRHDHEGYFTLAALGVRNRSWSEEDRDAGLGYELPRTYRYSRVEAIRLMGDDQLRLKLDMVRRTWLDYGER